MTESISCMDHKTVLVTGGDGFIGRNLVKALINRHIKVLVVDNNITSHPKTYATDDVQHIRSDICELDIKDLPPINTVFHLASVAAPLLYMQNPDLVLNPNSIGTRQAISICKQNGAELFFASTSEVYGNPPQLKGDVACMKEDDFSYSSLLTDRSPYLVAKRFGEELVNNFRRQGGTAVCLRFFNVFGPDMDEINTGYGRVVPNFLHSIQEGNPVRIFGDGSQTRSFLWIGDAIEALLSIMEIRDRLPPAINIGNDRAVSVLDLARIIAKSLNKSFTKTFEPKDPDDPDWRRPSLKRIKRLCGWVPETTLEDGIVRIIDTLNEDRNHSYGTSRTLPPTIFGDLDKC